MSQPKRKCSLSSFAPNSRISPYLLISANKSAVAITLPGEIVYIVFYRLGKAERKGLPGKLLVAFVKVLRGLKKKVPGGECELPTSLHPPPGHNRKPIRQTNREGKELVLSMSGLTLALSSKWQGIKLMFNGVSFWTSDPQCLCLSWQPPIKSTEDRWSNNPVTINRVPSSSTCLLAQRLGPSPT